MAQPSAASVVASSTVSMPFGGRRHAERIGEAEHGADDRDAVGIDHHPGDEAAVDLEHVDRQALEIGEAGIAGAEIVHRDGRVERLQRFEHARRARRVLDDRAFGQLQRQPVAGQAARPAARFATTAAISSRATWIADRLTPT